MGEAEFEVAVGFEIFAGVDDQVVQGETLYAEVVVDYVFEVGEELEGGVASESLRVEDLEALGDGRG